MTAAAVAIGVVVVVLLVAGIGSLAGPGPSYALEACDLRPDGSPDGCGAASAFSLSAALFALAAVVFTIAGRVLVGSRRALTPDDRRTVASAFALLGVAGVAVAGFGLARAIGPDGFDLARWSALAVPGLVALGCGGVTARYYQRGVRPV